MNRFKKFFLKFVIPALCLVMYICCLFVFWKQAKLYDHRKIQQHQQEKK